MPTQDKMSKGRSEQLVIAILYKVGPGIKLSFKKGMIAVFNKASQDHPELFEGFAMHPQYHDNNFLGGIFQNLLLGGGIIRERLTSHFQTSPHLLGPYGKSQYEQFSEEEKKIIDYVAVDLWNLFS